MRGRADEAQFRLSFELVARCLQKRFKNVDDRRHTEQAYFLALEDLPISAVEAAGVILCKEGTSDGWFPRTPEWIDIALRLHVSWQLESLVRRRDLPPSEHEVAAHHRKVSAARDRLVATARARGEDGIADFFARYVINHPASDAAAPFCPDCSDTGRRGRVDAKGVIGVDDYYVCGCCRTNPVLLQRRLEATQGGRFRHRRERAADLNPGRSEALLST